MRQLLTINVILLPALFMLAHGEDSLRKPVTKGEVLEFGLIVPLGLLETNANSEATLTGTRLTSPERRFSEQTNQVHATLGVLFGFTFKLSGVAEDGSAEIRKVITHPPIKNVNGQIEQQYSITEIMPVTNGFLFSVWGYRLNRPEELVPGVWICDVWYHDQKIVSQSFTVVTPGTSQPKTLNK